MIGTLTIVHQRLIIVTSRLDITVCGAQKHVDFAKVMLKYLSLSIVIFSEGIKIHLYQKYIIVDQMSHQTYAQTCQILVRTMELALAERQT